VTNVQVGPCLPPSLDVSLSLAWQTACVCNCCCCSFSRCTCKSRRCPATYAGQCPKMFASSSSSIVLREHSDIVCPTVDGLRRTLFISQSKSQHTKQKPTQGAAATANVTRITAFGSTKAFHVNTDAHCRVDGLETQQGARCQKCGGEDGKTLRFSALVQRENPSPHTSAFVAIALSTPRAHVACLFCRPLHVAFSLHSSLTANTLTNVERCYV